MRIQRSAEKYPLVRVLNKGAQKKKKNFHGKNTLSAHSMQKLIILKQDLSLTVISNNFQHKLVSFVLGDALMPA